MPASVSNEAARRLGKSSSVVEYAEYPGSEKLRFPFTEAGVRGLLDSGRVAPAGAGCLELAWRWRENLLPA